MENTNLNYPSPGHRFDNDLYPGAQRAGIREYPVGGVVSGATVAATIASGAGPSGSTLNLTISPGVVKLDATTIVIPSAITKSLNVVENLSVGNTLTQVVKVYLNPTRKVPASVTPPSSPVNGDKYWKVVDNVTYYSIDKFYKYNSTLSIWETYDPIKERIGYGQWSLPMNDVVPTVSASNVVAEADIERMVYHGTGIPVYLSAPAPAVARKTGAIVLAEITVTAGTINKIETPVAQKLYA